MATFAQVDTKRLVEYIDDNNQSVKMVVDNIDVYYQRRNRVVIIMPSFTVEMSFATRPEITAALALLDSFY